MRVAGLDRKGMRENMPASYVRCVKEGELHAVWAAPQGHAWGQASEWLAHTARHACYYHGLSTPGLCAGHGQAASALRSPLPRIMQRCHHGFLSLRVAKYALCAPSRLPGIVQHCHHHRYLNTRVAKYMDKRAANGLFDKKDEEEEEEDEDGDE